jgi:hypothetical protein
MARENEYETRRTRLRCIKNNHHYTDDIVWIGLYVAEQNEPDWRPDIEGMTCRYCDSRVEVVED